MSKWYKTCAELPLDNFIEITITGDLQPLIVEGNPTTEQLQTAWSEIFMEYSDLAPNVDQTYLLNLTRDIKVIEGKLQIIQSIVNVLSETYLEKPIEILREFGFYFEYTPETLEQDLLNTVTQARSLLVAKQVKEGEYAKYNEDNKGKQVTRNDYENILAALSAFQGYNLDSKVLTVSRFVAIFNRYNKQNGKQPKD